MDYIGSVTVRKPSLALELGLPNEPLMRVPMLSELQLQEQPGAEVQTPDADAAFHEGGCLRFAVADLEFGQKLLGVAGQNVRFRLTLSDLGAVVGGEALLRTRLPEFDINSIPQHRFLLQLGTVRVTALSPALT